MELNGPNPNPDGVRELECGYVDNSVDNSHEQTRYGIITRQLKTYLIDNAELKRVPSFVVTCIEVRQGIGGQINYVRDGLGTTSA